MKNKVCPEDMEKIIDAYARAVDNLNKHVHPKWQYPIAEHMRGLIRKGAEVCFHSLSTCIMQVSRVNSADDI
jgi:predicted ATP-binding protein involved in virulence